MRMERMMSKVKNKKGGSLNLSASAVSAWEDCPRKWGFSYIEKIETPKSESLAIGIAVHDMAEEYLLSGTPPDDHETNRWWRILEPGLEFLPSPVVKGKGMVGWQVETWLTDQMCGPLDVKGKVDFWRIEDAGLFVCDWKTTKDSTWRWSKTPDQLADLTQPLLYAYCLAAEHGRPPRLDFQHINMCVKGEPASMEVWARDVSWDAVDERWGKLVETAEDMASYANMKDISALDLPPNIKSCKKYGGCPHAHYCPASHINRHKPLTPAQQQKLVQQSNYTPDNRSTPMADLSALRASLGLNRKTNNYSKPVDKPTPKEQSSPAQAAAEVAEALRPAIDLGIPEAQLLKACEAKGVPAPVIVAGLKLAKVTTAIGPVYMSQGAASDLIEGDYETPDTGYADYENTTEAMDELSEALQEPAPVPELVSLGKDAPGAEAVVDMMLSNNETREEVLKHAAKDALGIRRLGSKRWSRIFDKAKAFVGHCNDLDKAVAIKRAELPPVSEVKAEEGKREEVLLGPKLPLAPSLDEDNYVPAKQLEPQAKQVTEPERTLESIGMKAVRRIEVFIDCTPSGEGTSSLTQVLAPHMEQVEKDHGVAHYSNVAYNEGTKLVVGLFKMQLQEQGPDGLPPTITVDSRHPLASSVIEVLERASFTRIIRGSR
jgi:hypothetical protein